MKLFSNFFRGKRVTGQKYALCFEGTNNWGENFAFCVEEHKWDHFTRVYIGALIPRVYIIYRCAGDASSPGGDASPRRHCQVGGRYPNLAIRKCIVFACQGIEPCQANADAVTRRPQVRTRHLQVREHYLLVRTRCLRTYIYCLEFLIDFSALHAPFKKIDMVNCTLE